MSPSANHKTIKCTVNVAIWTDTFYFIYHRSRNTSSTKLSNQICIANCSSVPGNDMHTYTFYIDYLSPDVAARCTFFIVIELQHLGMRLLCRITDEIWQFVRRGQMFYDLTVTCMDFCHNIFDIVILVAENAIAIIYDMETTYYKDTVNKLKLWIITISQFNLITIRNMQTSSW